MHGWYMRLVEDLVLVVVLAWSALCTAGACGWSACSWQDLGPIESVPQELVAWQRVQEAGLAWSACLCAALTSLAYFTGSVLREHRPPMSASAT